MPSNPGVGFGGRPILNLDDCQDAEARIARLAIAPEGSEEAAERVGLIDAVNAYRLSQRSPEPQGLEHAITSQADYEQATCRVAELADFPEGTPQATELADVIADIREWDETHKEADGQQQILPSR